MKPHHCADCGCEILRRSKGSGRQKKRCNDCQEKDRLKRVRLRSQRRRDADRESRA